MALAVDFSGCTVGSAVDRPDFVHEALVVQVQERAGNPGECQIRALGNGLFPLFLGLPGLFNYLLSGFSAKPVKVLKDQDSFCQGNVKGRITAVRTTLMALELFRKFGSNC